MFTTVNCFCFQNQKEFEALGWKKTTANAALSSLSVEIWKRQ